MVRLALFMATCLLMSCNQQAQSQESSEPLNSQTDFASVAEANTQVMLSRQNAITHAVEKASPAVVSVNVIGVERVQYTDPFAGDPWMEYFFGRRRSRVYERQVQAVGSGFVISPDGTLNSATPSSFRKLALCSSNGVDMNRMSRSWLCAKSFW